MEMPRTLRGNRYVVVFVEYLTKWVEAYAVEDQTSETLARLLVDCVVCRHGVPGQLLSDRGPNLLSNVLLDVCRLLGVKKVNTTSYHPQTDGLVERMNQTIRSMLAKHAHTFGPDWDLHLQQVLFAYRVKPQDSTGESPFYLLYGRDARLPTETAISQPLTPYQENLDDYRTGLVAGLSEAWEAARSSITRAQKWQKRQYDKRARPAKYHVGNRVMVFMPRETQGKQRKLALPHHGPYRVLELNSSCATVRPVDHPEAEPIKVNLDRLSQCPDVLPDVSWLGPRTRRSRTQNSKQGRRASSHEGV